MKVLAWHVHGSWMTSFVSGPDSYLLPVLPGRGPDGRGRARTWQWPAGARELGPAELADTAFDVVVLQRPQEIDLLHRWTGLRAGIDVPAVYVEHNTPSWSAGTRHPLADRGDITVVHVTHFNQLMWDCGDAPTTVIEHGIVDPGHLYTGHSERIAVVVNEPIRRLQRLLVGHADDVDMDGAGRILVAPALRDYAGLDHRVVLVGQGNRFELWDETRWQAETAQAITFSADGLPPELDGFSL